MEKQNDQFHIGDRLDACEKIVDNLIDIEKKEDEIYDDIDKHLANLHKLLDKMKEAQEKK